MIEAGWETSMNEVWTVFVPVEEACRRVQERNGLSQKEAEDRLNSQLSNKERIEKSHVIFCSLWEKPVTRGQVDRALRDLKNRI